LPAFFLSRKVRGIGSGKGRLRNMGPPIHLISTWALISKRDFGD
jgi:hypothetical protein